MIVEISSARYATSAQHVVQSLARWPQKRPWPQFMWMHGKPRAFPYGFELIVILHMVAVGSRHDFGVTPLTPGLEKAMTGW